ncbi:class I SAM-dependent methyltransferase [Candidatus Parcubacteria bacterium]|nr:MAG: class I SAM-dependent methyltransferase [Candidatus Parcubacteria bacterium]
MDFEQIKSYWEQRAELDNSAQSTTMDFYLRDIEFRVLRNMIEKLKPNRVMDIGCGDARTTARLALTFPQIYFIGGDYAESMVSNGRRVVYENGINNLEIICCDASKSLPLTGIDLIYTTRCLINLPSWDLQQQSLENIADSLSERGHYIMIENFIDGHDNFNKVRREFGLPEIPVRDHNLFFRREKLVKYVSRKFEIVEEINISSSYYLVSRIVYSKICQGKGVKADYFDEHHKYASMLPFCGEYGPVRMICLRRKE